VNVTIRRKKTWVLQAKPAIAKPTVVLAVKKESEKKAEKAAIVNSPAASLENDTRLSGIGPELAPERIAATTKNKVKDKGKTTIIINSAKNEVLASGATKEAEKHVVVSDKALQGKSSRHHTLSAIANTGWKANPRMVPRRFPTAPGSRPTFPQVSRCTSQAITVH
jgi:hypothetical protein